MLFVTYHTLVITTCATGEVWVLSQEDNMRGNGPSGNSATWYKVQLDNNDGGSANDGTLSGINAVRGCPGGLMALKSNGTLWACGDNFAGQLGTGNQVSSLTMIQIGTDNNWSKIIMGAEYVVALKNDGTLWSWG